MIVVDHWSFTLHKKVYNPDSAGIDFSRQNLTTKVDPRTVGVKILPIALCIQMNQKKLIGIFLMISR